MIRLVLALVAGIAIVLAVLGQDHGQRRAGLMAASDPAPAPIVAAETPAAKPEVRVFVPVAPQLIPAPAPGQPLVTEVSLTPAELPAADPQPAAQPEPAALTPALVVIQGVNLRGGPGRTYPVLASLKPGDRLEPIDDGTAPNGWQHVRLLDQSLEGYVSVKFIAPAPAD